MKRITDLFEEIYDSELEGMDIQKLSQLIYDYTSGYPVLVSMICKHMDESGNWENLSFENAVKYLVKEKNPLIESLINKLEDDKNLRNLLYNVLFWGRRSLIISTML